MTSHFQYDDINMRKTEAMFLFNSEEIELILYAVIYTEYLQIITQ